MSITKSLSRKGRGERKEKNKMLKTLCELSGLSEKETKLLIKVGF